jgi:hypothetical protein
MAKALNLPKGLPTARYRPSPKVEIPDGVSELPLIDKDTPPDKQVQEHWVAHVRVFRLNDPEELAEYTKVWQMICDGHAVQSERRTEFKPDTGEFVALLRWAELRYKVPSQ